jgi:hypothetical protein
MLRSISSVTRRCLPLLLAACRAHAPAPPPALDSPIPAPVPPQPDRQKLAPRTDARQILWQRDLDSALALAAAEDRPLLIALNMDGESASDRIVREEYRDPTFVQDTRPFVCLVASVFRHTPVDHDPDGRRIPCPRLGEVTCGEHVALEPLLYERFLSDGERVAPRHTIVRADGTKPWDLSLCFDLREIDQALAETAAAERTRKGTEGIVERPGSSWEELAARRDARGRAGLEAALERTGDERGLTEALQAIAQHGDAGSAEALRLVTARLTGVSPALRATFLETVRALGLEAAVAEHLRDRLRRLDPLPGAADPLEPELLPLLDELAGSDPALRTMVRSASVLTGYASDGGSALELRRLLAAGRAVSANPAGELPLTGRDRASLPAAEELEQALADLEARLGEAAADPDLEARFALLCLALGRQRVAAGQSPQGLFEDAEAGLGRALAERPDPVEWWIERARAAYFLARFGDQAAYARRAFEAATGTALSRSADLDVFASEPAIEALRWVGDADARLVIERAGGDAAEESAGAAEGLRALGIVAASPFGRPQDWTTFASLAGALGLWREEFAIARAGLDRYPTSPDLRAYVNNALWNGGRFDLVPFLADALVDVHATSADAWWYAGQAWTLAGDQARRDERPDAALDAYSRSRERYARAEALNPDYGASCQYQVALTWLGTGLAHARADRREEAADALVALVATGAPTEGLTDGLGYDRLDLVDKIGEWRVTGPSPVDPLALAERLDAVAPETPVWLVALSDIQLREALRADGRNPEKAMRDTVDAGGLPIRMLLGLPNEEGDAYLLRSIGLARRALPRITSAEDRKSVAQAETIWAERNLERGRSEGVAEALAEASAQMGLPALPSGADRATLEARAAELRGLLGEARPRWRAGR